MRYFSVVKQRALQGNLFPKLHALGIVIGLVKAGFCMAVSLEC